MFTGIIECLGKVEHAASSGSNISFWISSEISSQLNVDQSVSHNGICLTVETVENGNHKVTCIKETLEKTNAGNWMLGESVNIERSLVLNGRLDGHLVQGHVDDTGRCISREDKNGSTEFTFQFDKKHSSLIIEKGSICLNGVSLTLFNITGDQFSVAIIPYTLEHTNLSRLVEGSEVNIEFDMVGKYINRINFLNGH